MKTELFLQRALHMWPVKILSLAAAILLYFITSLLALETRTLSVPIHYILPNSYTQADEYPTRARVQIRGNSQKIFAISEDDLQITADFSSSQTEGDYQAPLKIKRLGSTAEIQPLELNIEPGNVKLNIEKSVSKDVPVEVSFSGAPKPGYQVSSYSLALKSVRITGPRSRLNSISVIPTEDIDLSSRNANFIQRVHLRSPDSLVKVQNSEALDCSVEVREVSSSGNYTGLSIGIVGLDPSLMVTNRLLMGTIKVQAGQDTLNAIKPEDIHLIVDASSVRSPGKYTLKVIPEVPTELMILQYEPTKVEIVVSLESKDKTP